MQNRPTLRHVRRVSGYDGSQTNIKHLEKNLNRSFQQKRGVLAAAVIDRVDIIELPLVLAPPNNQQAENLFENFHVTQNNESFPIFWALLVAVVLTNVCLLCIYLKQ